MRTDLIIVNHNQDGGNPDSNERGSKQDLYRTVENIGHPITTDVPLKQQEINQKMYNQSHSDKECKKMTSY